MIALPPYVLLLPFGIFMAGYLFFALANIISLAKYGAKNAVGLLASFIFVCGTAVILFVAWQQSAGIAWTTPVPLFEAGSFNL